jgi:hypothetical protein
MAVYDCRPTAREAGSIGFPCSVRIIDPATGARIANVFYAGTAPAKLGRFVTGPDGEPLVDPKTRRKKWVTDPDGRRRIEIVWDRLEVWTLCPWVAVAADTGEVVAKSEGCP